MGTNETELTKAMEKARHLRIAFAHVDEDPGADAEHVKALSGEIAAADAEVVRLSQPD